MAYYKGNKRKDSNQGELFGEPIYTIRTDLQEFVVIWNANIWLPKIIGTDRQIHMIREAMMRPFFKNNWRDSFKMLSKSSFLINKMRPKFTLDWFLIPDNFDKVFEGKYINSNEPTITNPKSTIDKDGNEKIL